uniref:mitogen-activated protein kinase kinase n=1 Tax=Octactis speculum TaxID=3111310 RepID=A0A7S2GXN1_9STRA|mmetsp:Transcript_59086/g.80690  ORF Transcript_59086/g.80690 Transcript_59086/m.80690 type:complete len:360 (+) Transcript_59086:1-1080(+)
MDNNCSCFPSQSIIGLCTARQRAPIEQCRNSLATSLPDSCDDEPVMHINDTHAKTPRLPTGVAKWTGQENDALAFTEEDMGELWEAVFAGRLIGSGNFGSVAVATFRNRSVAVKMQPMPQPDEEWAQEIVDNLVCELSVLRSICHRSPYMVDFLGAGRVGNDIFSVMGLASRGDLRQVIEKCEVGEGRMDWVSLARVLRDASYGLAYLHKHELLHRDFKTPNVLVQEDGSGLLCDFGFTIWADSPAKLETCAGTEEFMAPELCMGEDFHLPADVFSLGITICEVATRIRPGDNDFLYRSPRNMFAFEPEVPHVHAVITEDFPLMLASIAEQCCQFEENKRLSASAAATSLHDLISEWSS